MTNGEGTQILVRIKHLQAIALILGLMALNAGCGQPSSAPAPLTPLPTTSPTFTASPTPTYTATPMATWTFTPAPTPTATPKVTLTPTGTPRPTNTPTPTLTPTPTPHPMEPYTIEGLRARDYAGGTIEIRRTYTTTASYTRYYIAYPSDGLAITGVMCVPHGKGPFPVVILNHGYIPPSRYWSGADTWYASAYLARHGYLTLASDFRGWGGSDSGVNYFRSGLVIDVLNLISSLPSLPEADPARVGMWGHSMGGGVTTKALTVDRRILAAVLYAPVSANDRAFYGRWRGGSGPILASDRMELAYYRARRDPGFLRRVSPIYYSGSVTAAVQIHTGTADKVTPPRWAKDIRDALKYAGKEMEFYSYEGQGHAFHGQSWALFMERVSRFFDRHLKER